MDYAEILATVPHRHPFLMVDDVVELQAGKRIVAKKAITGNDVLLQDGNAFPGLMMVEAIAQAAVFLVAKGFPDGSPLPANPLYLLTGIKHMVFEHEARPGDLLTVQAEIVRVFSAAMIVRGSVEAPGGRSCAHGELIFAVRE